MSTRDTLKVMRAHARDNGRDVACRQCQFSTLLRGDTGLCEKCHAKQPEVTRAWERQRRAVDLPAPYKKSKRLPPGSCIVCREPYGDDSIQQHDKRCAGRPEVCACGKRYWTSYDLRAHQYNCKVFRSDD